MDKKDKELEFLRGLDKLRAADVKSSDYTSPLDQDVMKVKGSAPVKESVTRIAGGTDKIDTKQIAKVISGNDFQSKIQSLLKGGGKKALAALPMAGAIGAALQGDPAMAAEELVMDLPGMEAVRSDSAGMSPEDERLMLQEIKAQQEYDRSPAKMDRLRGLLQGGRTPAASDFQKQALDEIKKEVPMPDFSSNIPPEKFDEERMKAREKQEMLRRLLEKQRD